MANRCADELTRPQIGRQWILDNVTWPQIAATVLEKRNAGILTDGDIDLAVSQVRTALGQFLHFLTTGDGNQITTFCLKSAEWGRAAVDETAFANKMISGWESLKATAPSTNSVLFDVLPNSIAEPLSKEVIQGSGVTYTYVVVGLILLIILLWLVL